MPSVNLRLPDDLHAAASAEAAAGNVSLNSAICDALRDWVTTRAQARREDALLDRFTAEHADTLAMIRDSE
ncbi:toxin-antitoxin system HicB family antitoxin [Nocardia sp.]|uniref:toxin-antitoxin system HicB family antitoxin n=1 Tax=Nocardia sp. TaxID=1821 RepID=UPI002613E1B4|nr:toxin-antitoxin system HicB family antitoxin [Nocardia sp.]